MKGNLGDLMKQAQQMQAKLQEAQKQLAEMVVEGKAGTDPLEVRVTMNGQHYVTRVAISSDLLEEDKSILEDLVAAAINDAARKIEKGSRDKMTSITAGMQLPAGLDVPFGEAD